MNSQITWHLTDQLVQVCRPTPPVTEPTVAFRSADIEPSRIIENRTWTSQRVFHLGPDNTVNSLRDRSTASTDFKEAHTALGGLVLQIPLDSPIAALGAREAGWSGNKKSHAPSRGLQLRAQELLDAYAKKHKGTMEPAITAGPQDYIKFKWNHPSRELTVAIFDEGNHVYSCDWHLEAEIAQSKDSDVFSLNFLMAAIDNFLAG